MQFLPSLSLFTALTNVMFASVTAEPAPKPIFNGHDLSGWVAMHGGEWRAEDGILVGRNGTNWTTNPEYSGSWLRTAKEYGDFVLELEYAIGPKSNSGIHFRSALEKNPSFTGYEMQINDDAGREPRKSGTGSLYAVVAPSKNTSKPAGEWNKVRIMCRANSHPGRFEWRNNCGLHRRPVGSRLHRLAEPRCTVGCEVPQHSACRTVSRFTRQKAGCYAKQQDSPVLGRTQTSSI